MEFEFEAITTIRIEYFYNTYCLLFFKFLHHFLQN